MWIFQNSYSDELALFYLLKGDNDRANYYVDNSYQQFITVYLLLFCCELVLTHVLS